MALQIGQNTAFERIYLSKFRELAAAFGEFVEYSRDLAARDIGLHFVSRKSDGGEIVEPSLVWFQLKGRQSCKFSEEDFDACDNLSVRVSKRHLQFWYLAPEPTYLVLYIQAKDEFFVVDIKEYVKTRFGDEILSAPQQELTVRINKSSVLDTQSFRVIKLRCSVAAWRDRIYSGDKYADVFFRDAELIQCLSTAGERGVSIILVLIKYISKSRTEAYFIEQPEDPARKPKLVHQHWEVMMPEDLSLSFPYIDFYPADVSFAGDIADEEDAIWPPLKLPNGGLVCAEFDLEQVKYRMKASLNDIGKAWAQTLDVMVRAGFVQLDDDQPTSVSVAPWHARDV